MRKPAATLEWQIAKNEREWEQSDQLVPPLSSQRGKRRRLGEVLLLIGVLVGVGGWRWYATQAEWQQIQTELTAAVQREVTATAPAVQLAPAQAEPALRVAGKPKLPNAQLAAIIHLLKLHGDQALVQVLTPAVAHTSAYRQTQFYRRTSAGWQQTAPDATLWGPPQELETASFRWRYQANDRQVIARVAPQLELLYTTLRRDFGLVNVPQRAKLVIAVSVTQPAGDVSPWFGAAEEYGVTSPALYWAPTGLAEAEILAQSLALPLLNTVMAQAREHYRLHTAWQPLLQGLRLWRFWELDLPLSTWRPEVVAWLYAELSRADVGQRVVLPARYADLCAAHTLWLPSPLLIGIPLTCNKLDQQAGHFATTAGRNLVLHLTHHSALSAGSYAESFVQGVGDRGQTVALASLLEYAVATYGRERLPVLLASLGQHANWETLLPAVYEVSAAEFEAGWREFVAAHYGG